MSHPGAQYGEDEEDEEDEELAHSRNYFLAKEIGSSASGKKVGRKKLSDLNLVDEQVLRSAVSVIVPKHEKEIASLLKSYTQLYPKWLFELRCGFNLLMHGFGSKKTLLEDFASTTLTENGVLVINGYLPSINIKQVMITIAELWSEQLKTKRKRSAGTKSKVQLPFSSQTVEDLLSFLSGPFPDENMSFICIVIHNIDGPALRDSESQQYLSRIASLSRVRMVASIDHVNSPLL